MDNSQDKNQYEQVGDVVRIFQRGENWYANFQYRGRQRRISLKTSSKKEARRLAIQIEADILQGRYKQVAPPPDIALVIANYLQYLQAERRAKKTLSKYKAVLNRVAVLAEQKHISTIDGIDIRFMDLYRSERASAGAAPKPVYDESILIRQLVNFALSRKMIQDDPLHGFRLNKPRPTPQPCWTPNEVEKILAASAEPEKSKFMVLADTGMRVGELRHLTWDDVDFVKNVLHIRPKDDWKPKSGDQRSIPMKGRVRAMLEKLPRRGRWIFTARQSQKYPNGDHQFSDRHLLVSLKRVLKKLGLVGHVHTFRHAFISDALTQGIPEAIVRQWVGHVDAEVIKLYTHIADAASQSAMQRLMQSKTDGTERTSAPKVENVGTDSAHSQHTERSEKNEEDAA